jgi:hypothetical protein
MKQEWLSSKVATCQCCKSKAPGPFSGGKTGAQADNAAITTSNPIMSVRVMWFFLPRA